MVVEMDRVLRWRMEEIKRLREENRRLENTAERWRKEAVRGELRRPLAGAGVEAVRREAAAAAAAAAAEIEHLTRQRDGARAEAAAAQRDNRALFVALTAHVSTLPRGVSDADATELMEALGAAAAAAQAGEARAEAAEAELAAMMVAVAEVRDSAAHLLERNSILEAEVDSLRTKTAVFDKQFGEALVETDALREFAHSRASETAQLATQVEALTSERHDLELTIADETAFGQDLEARYAAALDLNAALEAKLDALSLAADTAAAAARIAELERSLADAHDARAAAAAAAADAAAASAADAATLRKANLAARSMDKLQHAYLASRSEVGDLKAEATALRARIDDLEHELARVKLAHAAEHNVAAHDGSRGCASAVDAPRSPPPRALRHSHHSDRNSTTDPTNGSDDADHVGDADDA